MSYGWYKSRRMLVCIWAVPGWVLQICYGHHSYTPMKHLLKTVFLPTNLEWGKKKQISSYTVTVTYALPLTPA